MKMIEGLLKTPEQVPKITERMKQQWIQAIGDEVIVRQPDYHPDHLHAFSANGEPAFACGAFSFHPYEGPKTWANAWKQALLAAEMIREKIFGRKSKGKKPARPGFEQTEVVGDSQGEISLIIDSKGPLHSRVYALVGGKPRYPRDAEQGKMWEVAFKRFEQEWKIQVLKALRKMPEAEGSRYMVFLENLRDVIKSLILGSLVLNTKRKTIGGVDVIEALPSKALDVRAELSEYLKNAKEQWLTLEWARKHEGPGLRS